MTLLTDYQLFYSKQGKLKAVNDPDGNQLPFDPENKTFDEAHQLTLALRALEVEEEDLLNLDDLPIDPSLEAAKARKRQEIIDEATLALNELVTDHPPAEQATWTTKLRESEAILAAQADGETIDIDIIDLLTPVIKIEAIAYIGGDETTPNEIIVASVIAHAENIILNSQQLFPYTQGVIGKRNRLKDAVKAATTFEEVEAIGWDT